MAVEVPIDMRLRKKLRQRVARGCGSRGFVAIAVSDLLERFKSRASNSAPLQASVVEAKAEKRPRRALECYNQPEQADKRMASDGREKAK